MLFTKKSLFIIFVMFVATVQCSPPNANLRDDPSTATSTDTTAAGGDTTAAGGDTTATGGDTTAAGGDTTAAGGDTTGAGGDTTAAGGDTTAAGGDTTEAPEPSGSNMNVPSMMGCLLITSVAFFKSF